MWKDLRLAQDAARQTGAATPMGAQAQALLALFANSGHAETDFSGIINMIRGKA
jgi:3-hydroxyisobutyrate dehydrogenase